MNLSGESLRALTDFYKIDVETELLVIYDDISLDVGQLRIRKKGSAGGHNGIKSIISHLGTNVFPRIKVGVGEKPSGYDLADYVLGHFSKDDRAKKMCIRDRAYSVRVWFHRHLLMRDSHILRDRLMHHMQLSRIWELHRLLTVVQQQFQEEQ